MNWLAENWHAVVTVISASGGIGALVRFGPRLIRRVVLMLDCEVDRLRWEEADKLRNREIALLRQDVANLQNDIARLLARSVASGAASAGAGEPPTTPPTTSPSSAT